MKPNNLVLYTYLFGVVCFSCFMVEIKTYVLPPKDLDTVIWKCSQCGLEINLILGIKYSAVLKMMNPKQLKKFKCTFKKAMNGQSTKKI